MPDTTNFTQFNYFQLMGMNSSACVIRSIWIQPVIYKAVKVNTNFKCQKEKSKSSAWRNTQKNVLMLFWKENFTCQLLCKHGYSTSWISLTWAKIHTEHCVSIYFTYVTKGNKSKQEVEPGQVG